MLSARASPSCRSPGNLARRCENGRTTPASGHDTGARKPESHAAAQASGERRHRSRGRRCSVHLCQRFCATRLISSVVEVASTEAEVAYVGLRDNPPVARTIISNIENRRSSPSRASIGRSAPAQEGLVVRQRFAKARRGNLKEAAHLERQRPLACMKDVDGDRRRFVALQHDFELTLAHVPGNLIGKYVGQSNAGKRSIDGRLRGVDGEASEGANGFAMTLCALRERPCRSGSENGERHAAMLLEVGRCFWPAMSSEIGGARDTDAAYAPVPCRHHGAVGEVADTHRHVNVIVDEVDVAVREQDPDSDLGERGDEITHHRKYMQSAENDRRRERELAAWDAVLA